MLLQKVLQNFLFPNMIIWLLNRISKPKVSLKYLKKALQVEIITLNDKSNIAGTHLNICAILSSLNEYKS